MLTTEQKAALFDLGIDSKQAEKIGKIFTTEKPAEQEEKPAPVDNSPAGAADVLAVLAAALKNPAPEPEKKPEPEPEKKPEKQPEGLTRADMEELLQRFALNTAGGVVEVPKSNEDLLRAALDDYWDTPKAKKED